MISIFGASLSSPVGTGPLLPLRSSLSSCSSSSSSTNARRLRFSRRLSSSSWKPCSYDSSVYRLSRRLPPSASLACSWTAKSNKAPAYNDRQSCVVDGAETLECPRERICMGKESATKKGARRREMRRRAISREAPWRARPPLSIPWTFFPPPRPSPLRLPFAPQCLVDGRRDPRRQVRRSNRVRVLDQVAPRPCPQAAPTVVASWSRQQQPPKGWNLGNRSWRGQPEPEETVHRTRLPKNRSIWLPLQLLQPAL